MRFLFFPFFVFFLTIKNVESWIRIATEAFGAQVMIVSLILINAGLGALLYHEIQQSKIFQQKFEAARKNIDTHKEFWDKLEQEFPESIAIQDAQKILQKN